MFQEFFERMTKELTAMAPSAMRIKVVAPTQEFVVWFLFLSVFS